MNTILQKRIEEAAEVFPFNFPSELFHSLQTQHERKLWKDEIEQAYIYGGEDSLQNQWISVEEALPEDKTKVFVIVKTPVGIVHRADYHINDYWYMSRYSPEEIVTHWMPIPSLEGGEK